MLFSCRESRTQDAVLNSHLSMHNRVIDFLKSIFQDRFKRYLIISLMTLGIIVGYTSHAPSSPCVGFEVHFFYFPGCSYCEEQELFNKKLEDAYSINITRHDAATPGGSALLAQMLEELGVEKSGFPVTIVSGWVFAGWESEETTGRAIEQALKRCLAASARNR